MGKGVLRKGGEIYISKDIQRGEKAQSDLSIKETPRKFTATRYCLDYGVFHRQEMQRDLILCIVPRQ